MASQLQGGAAPPPGAAKPTITKVQGKALEGLEANADAETEEYSKKQKEVEQIDNPILKELYQAAGGPKGGAPGGAPGGFHWARGLRLRASFSTNRLEPPGSISSPGDLADPLGSA